MIGATASEFIGSRCRFYRVGDCQAFNGWIVSLSKRRITLRCHSADGIEDGQSFLFEAFGMHSTAVFTATATLVGTHDDLEIPYRDPVIKNIAETNPIHIELSLDAPPSYLPKKEVGRILTSGFSAKIRTACGLCHGIVIDVSLGGLGIKSSKQFDPGEPLKIEFSTPVGDVMADCSVVHSGPIEKEPGMFRTGLRMSISKRVDQVRWRLFTGQDEAA